MSNKGKTFAGTIRSLEDLRGRCVINDETGCWVLRTGDKYGVPRSYFVHPATGEKLVWTATKVAWLLAGNPEPAKGAKIYRHQCMTECCVNPEHLRAGTSKQIGACITRHGKHIGRPERIAVNTRNARKRSALTPEIVREIRASNEGNTELGRIRAFFEANPHEELTYADVAAKFGITEVTARQAIKMMRDRKELESLHVIRLTPAKRAGCAAPQPADMEAA